VRYFAGCEADGWLTRREAGQRSMDDPVEEIEEALDDLEDALEEIGLDVELDGE